MKIDPKKLYTQKAYADKIGVGRSRVNQLITAGKVEVIEIHGSRLIYCP